MAGRAEAAMRSTSQKRLSGSEVVQGHDDEGKGGIEMPEPVRILPEIKKT